MVVIEHMNPFKPEEPKEPRDDDEIDYLNSVIIQEVSYYLNLKMFIFYYLLCNICQMLWCCIIIFV